jgi:hypothetical protein
MCSHVPDVLASHSKLSQLAAFQECGPGWSSPRRFHCSQIWKQMLDNLGKHLSFTFPLVYFSCGALLQNVVCLVLTVFVFLGWLITNNRVKTSARIHHISLATFTMLSNENCPKQILVNYDHWCYVQLMWFIICIKLTKYSIALKPTRLQRIV